MNLVHFLNTQVESVFINPDHVTKITATDRAEVRTVNGREYTRSFSVVTFSNGHDIVVCGDVDDVVDAMEGHSVSNTGWYDDTGSKCRFPGAADPTPTPTPTTDP